jgi:hypothetical protein
MWLDEKFSSLYFELFFICDANDVRRKWMWTTRHDDGMRKMMMGWKKWWWDEKIIDEKERENYTAYFYTSQRFVLAKINLNHLSFNENETKTDKTKISILGCE